MEIHVKITGGLLIALSFLHLIFPRYFDWDKDLAPLSTMNRQMMYVHTFFIGLIIFMMGLLCTTSGHELTETVLGKRISLGLSVFWGLRLFIQFFGYSSALWRGKAFETVVHIIFILLWTYLTVIFSLVFWG